MLVSCLAKDYQFGFQMPATGIMEGIINLHHSVMTFLVLILLFVGWVLFRTTFLFSHTKNPKAFVFNHSVFLETVWTLIPCVILIAIAVPSFALVYTIDEIVYPEVTYKVVGRQWYWTYEYTDIYTGNSHSFDSYLIAENDLTSNQFRLLSVDNELYLPLNTPVRLVITGGDVIHSWAVPSLGVKVDAIPGRLNQVNLNIKYSGMFFGQCSELCGVNHGFMPIVVNVINPFFFHILMDYKTYVEPNGFLKNIGLASTLYR